MTKVKPLQGLVARIKHWLMALAVLLAFAKAGFSKAEPFIRPFGAYYDYVGVSRPSGFTKYHPQASHRDEWGSGLAFGEAFGAGENHELSLEWGYVPWNSMTYAGRGQFTFIRTGGGKMMPYLANYRYFSGTADSKVRAYIGPSAGIANVRGNYTLPLSGPVYLGDFNAWTPLFGGAGGLFMKINRRISVDAGYRYIFVNGFDAQLYPFGDKTKNRLQTNSGNFKANVFYFGLNAKF